MKPTRTALLRITALTAILMVPWTSLQAQQGVVEQENGNVIRISNFQVTTDLTGTQTYDVEFQYITGFEAYGQHLIFTFLGEEDAAIALNQVMERLNAENPRPTGASSAGRDQFFIGAEEDNQTHFIGAVGAQNFAGIWDQCDRDCVAGVRPLNPTDRFVYAVFRPADTQPPPPPEPEPDAPPLVDGQWVTSLVESQGFVFFFTDGLVRDQNYISMIVMWPNNSKWDLFWGPEDSPGSALLEPWLSTSDMKARWIQNGADGTLMVESCTRDCPLEDGTVAPFLKWFGDGLNPGGSE